MYRRILVPIDGSPTSLLGLKHAIGLAKDQRARLCLLNVVDGRAIAPMLMDSSAAAHLPVILDSLREAGRKALAKAAALAAKSGVKPETIQVESGPRRVSDAILAEARRYRCDAIVMGTHGRPRTVNRVLIGSDAEGVLRATPVPILLVRLAPARRRERKARR